MENSKVPYAVLEGEYYRYCKSIDIWKKEIKFSFIFQNHDRSTLVSFPQILLCEKNNCMILFKYCDLLNCLNHESIFSSPREPTRGRPRQTGPSVHVGFASGPAGWSLPALTRVLPPCRPTHHPPSQGTGWKFVDWGLAFWSEVLLA